MSVTDREVCRKFLLRAIACIAKEEICFTEIVNLSLGFPLKQNDFALGTAFNLSSLGT